VEGQLDEDPAPEQVHPASQAEADVSTGTSNERRPALTVLPRCVSPGPYPSENQFVKIREL
jgi:hypothetical protein